MQLIKNGLVLIGRCLCLSILLGLPVIAHALSEEELLALTSSVKEMCESPTKTGEKFEIEGAAEGGVLVKIIGAKLEGRVNQKTWEGIEQIRETQAERLSCVTTVLGLLAPMMSPAENEAERRLSVIAQNKALNWKFEENGGLITYWVILSQEKIPKLTIYNPQCRVLIWLTNVVIDGKKALSTGYQATDSHLMAQPHEVFEHTFKYESSNILIDAFKSTEVYSDAEAERLVEYYSEPKDQVEVELVMRRHWEDSEDCAGDYTLQYVDNPDI